MADRVKHNQTSFKKLEREQEDDFESEAKRLQQEQTKQYRTKKDAFKRVNTQVFLSNEFQMNFIRRKFPILPIDRKVKKKMKFVD